jgi:hypothetical protein
MTTVDRFWKDVALKMASALQCPTFLHDADGYDPVELLFDEGSTFRILDSIRIEESRFGERYQYTIEDIPRRIKRFE